MNQAVHTMSREEALDFYNAGHGSYYFEQATSRAASSLVSALRGGSKADPSNIGTAIRTAGDLERRLETIAVLRNIPAAAEPSIPRPMPTMDDLPALLSSAGSDARYVKQLTYGGAGMAIGSNIAEALRVVRGLRVKLEAAWTIYDAMPKQERIVITPEAQAEFWRKLEAGINEAEALDG